MARSYDSVKVNSKRIKLEERYKSLTAFEFIEHYFLKVEPLLREFYAEKEDCILCWIGDDSLNLPSAKDDAEDVLQRLVRHDKKWIETKINHLEDFVLEYAGNKKSVFKRMKVSEENGVGEVTIMYNFFTFSDFLHLVLRKRYMRNETCELLYASFKRTLLKYLQEKFPEDKPKPKFLFI